MKPRSIALVVVVFVLASVLGASGAISQALGFDGWFGIAAPAKPPAAKPAPAPTLETLESDLALEQHQKKDFEGFRSFCRCGLDQHRTAIREARQALGAALIAGIFPAHAAGITEAMSALSAAEQEQLSALLRKLGLAQGGRDEQ